MTRLPKFTNQYSATRPPPDLPGTRKKKFSTIRKAITYLFAALIFAILLLLAWYLVLKGYLASMR